MVLVKVGDRVVVKEYNTNPAELIGRIGTVIKVDTLVWLLLEPVDDEGQKKKDVPYLFYPHEIETV